MRTLFRLLALTALVATGAALALLMAMLQDEPGVAGQQEVNHEDVARAMLLLRAHDPRRARSGTVNSVLVRERDLEVLLSQGARRWLNAAVRVRLQSGQATVQLTSSVPANPFGRWLNLEMHLQESDGLPLMDRFRVGSLPVPPWLAERVGGALAERAGMRAELDLAADVVHRVRFSAQQMSVNYAWQGDSAGRLIGGLLSTEDLQRLRPYAERLVELAARQRASFEVPLASLLGPVFDLARQRTAAGADAAAENRAALLVLTLHANGRTVGTLAAAARTWPQPRPMRLLLGGREDFPLHFLVSATLASEGTTPLSKAIGLYKEVADSRGGSGFSFNDVAANRAGTRFGGLAVQAPQQLQERLALGVRDADLLPRTDDLPEFMAEAEFRRRFGGVGAPAYNALLAEIDRRIAALSLLR